MGWRSSYTRILERDEPDGITYAALKRVEAAMLSMPHPDRIALARELLEGTGRVVARDVDAPEIATSWFAGGWVACRATMLADDGENND